MRSRSLYLLLVLVLLLGSIIPDAFLGAQGLTYSLHTPLANAKASFYGEVPDGQIGNTTSIAGDVNGDGIDDILIGAPSWDGVGTDSGKTYLFFGKVGGFDASINLSSADASFLGEASWDSSGNAVSIVGDVNGDGFDDILIGAYGNNENGLASGQSYLIFGKASGWAKDTSLADSDASFQGEGASDISGLTVAGAGDVNGDGYDDFIIGSYGNNYNGNVTGKVHLVLGRPSGWSMDLKLSMADASFRGEVNNALFGATLAGVGDVNGDNYDDFVIGAFQDGTVSPDAGVVYLVEGRATSWTRDVDISTIATASFVGENPTNYAGFSVAGKGDVNGDGLDDFLIGAVNNDIGGGSSPAKTGAGKAYVIFGKASGWSLSTNLSEADASFIGEGPSNDAGWSLACSGDVNGDGFDDIVVASLTNMEAGPGAGQVYLILGKATGWSQNKNLSGSDASFLGEAPFDFAGYYIASGGDTDGDGYDDVLITAANNSRVAHNTGRVYLISPDHNAGPFSITGVKAYSDAGFSHEISQALVNDTIYVEMRGVDGNSSKVDFAPVWVTSNLSSRAGIKFNFRETGLATGIYRGNFTISGQTREEKTLVRGGLGETVTITSVTEPSKKTQLFLGLDDLKFNGIAAVPTDATRGQLMNVTAIVRNSGLRDLKGVQVMMQAYWTDTPGATIPLGSKNIDINKGTTLKVSMEWDTANATGNYTVKATVDDPKKFAETNESDNNVTTSVEVLPKGDDLQISVNKTYERGQTVKIILKSALGLMDAKVRVLFPNGTLAFEQTLTLAPGVEQDVQFPIMPSHPLGKYDVRLTYHGISNGTSFEIVSQTPTISSPLDLITIEGSTGNFIEWSCSDISPKDYTVTRNGSAFKNGPWTSGAIRISIDGLLAGSYDFVLKVTDTAGNSASDLVKVQVNPVINLVPAVAIERPAPGASISGVVQINGTALDIDGTVTLVEIRIDGGSWQKAAGSETWSMDWDSRSVTNGPHTIKVRAFDDKGGEGNTSFAVLVENNLPPVLTVLGPLANATVGSILGIWGTATDPEGDDITVQVQIDGREWIYARGARDWRFEWDTLHVANGDHTLSIKASDSKGATSMAKVTLRVDNAPRAAQTVVETPTYADPIPVSVVTVSTVSFIGVAFLMTDLGRWALFKALFLAAYSKRKDVDVLDNFIRGWIQGVVVRDPGLRPIDIVESFEGNYSTNLVYYHLNELVRFGFIYQVIRNRHGDIVKIRKGVDGRILETEHISPKEKETNMTLRNSRLTGMTIHIYPSDMVVPNSQLNIRRKQRFNIYKFIKDHPGMNQTEISETLDMVRQTVAYHIKELQKDGFLIVGTSGKTNYYYIDQEVKVDLRKDGQPAAEPAQKAYDEAVPQG